MSYNTSQKRSFPYAETGPRDECQSVGYSENSDVHPENFKTTYVKDYIGKDAQVNGTLGGTFKSGITNPKHEVVEYSVSNSSQNRSKASSKQTVQSRTFEERNATYQGITKVYPFDEDKYSPIKQAKHADMKNTTYNKDFKNRGRHPGPFDANELYTNNMGNPRPEDVNGYMNETSMKRDFKGHWHAEAAPQTLKSVQPREPASMKKKSTYKKEYTQPKQHKMKLQTTTQQGLSYANKFVDKPMIRNIDTSYNASYNTHQQRVLATLNQLSQK